ncbi:MAG: hypothetical protein GY903_20490 [Fuerstiella sp.]|nr:hypothetical protein [Fuerstiella sp.]
MQKDARPALDRKSAADTTVPSTPAEMFKSLNLTAEQKAQFEPVEEERRAAEAGFKKLNGEDLRKAQNDFRKDRRKKIREIFTDQQWSNWTTFWNRQRTGVASKAKAQPAATPARKIDLSKNPIIQSLDNPDLIGRKGFVHVERRDGIWFMVNADGVRFVPTGMNHVGHMHRFAPYNREFWLKQFGSDVFTSSGRIDWKGPGVKRWLERIAKDHKDNGFNTLAFHHPLFMPTEYCNELELYYFGKMKMSHVNAKRAPKMSPDGKYPDVFSPAWIQKLDTYTKNYTARHKDAKYLLGYSFEDLPAYTIHHLEKRITEFEHHPWVIDIISKPGLTRGKQAWIDVLRQQYDSPAKAAEMYELSVSAEISDWDGFGEVTQWGLPKDSKQGFADQSMMNARIVEAYLKAHHDAIRRHDPNHLILGDMIQNQRPQPDWVWNIVRKYVDVIVIQDYDFFTPEHAEKLRHIHSITHKPIINGDHSYGVLRPNMKAVKGVKVESAEAKGREYATYLRGVMKLPFVVGWQTCGYLETWEGTADATGKQQTGFFDPFGNPIREALLQAKAANEQAVHWHEQAGASDNVYSKRRK